MSDPEFVASHRSRASSFSRTRKLGFKFLVLFLLNQVKGALQREFDDFVVRALGLGLAASVTAAAICVARRALKFTVFEALNRRFIEQFGKPAQSLWHGLRVMAVDASILNLPATAELFKHFSGQVQGKRRLPMARLSQLLEVDSGLSWHAIVSPLSRCERVLAAEHIEHAPANAVLLYDRGYASFFLMALLRDQQRNFCMRLQRGFHVGADRLLDSPQGDTQIRLNANPRARRLCNQYGVSLAEVSLRLIRVVLPTGEVEILATSLSDCQRFPEHDFAALYAKRWAIEGDFRIQKSRQQMENFTGKRPHAIYQDVHARILSKNLACWLTSIVQARLDQAAAAEAAAATQKIVEDSETHAPVKKKPRKHRQRINLTDALHACKHLLITIMLGAATQLESLLNRMQRHRHAERKGRSRPRDKRTSKAAVRWPMAYKQTG